MKRHGYRQRWRTEVIRSPHITDSVRVLLLVLADTMTDAGYVSVPRTKLAELLGRSPSRITERIQLAIEAGYLGVVRSGSTGRTAEYHAITPSHDAPVRTNDMVRIAATVVVHPSAPPWMRSHGAPVGPTNTRVTNATEKRSDREVSA